jgi:hypothetical protein
VGGALRWNLTARAVSPGFDVSETGFQRQSDWLLLAGNWRYDRFTPGRPVRAWAVGSENIGLGWTWAGDPRARVLSGFGSIDLRSYWSFKLTATQELPALSIERLRGGPALLLPARRTLALSAVTDQRRPTYASLDAAWAREPGSGSSDLALRPFVNVRTSDRLQFSLGPTWESETVGCQPVARVDAEGGTRVIVSRLRQHTLALTLRADVIFTPRLALQLYAQPFATVGRTDALQRLVDPRAPDPAARFAPVAAVRQGDRLRLDLDGDGAFESDTAWPDGQQRSLDGSVVLRWEYRPGSTVIAVWNHRRDAFLPETDSPTRALRGVFDLPATNVLLVKASFRLGS